VIFGPKAMLTGMNIAYLLIGGNLGNRQQNLAHAITQITEASKGNLLAQSGLYETAAWGNTNQPAFLNQALQISTHYTAATLLKKLLAVEENIGRVRAEKFGPRVIDIDIIFFNQQVIQTKNLLVPHPYMQQRRFVLVPLQEIAPHFTHPVLQKTVTQLLADCPDNLAVTKYN